MNSSYSKLSKLDLDGLKIAIDASTSMEDLREKLELDQVIRIIAEYLALRIKVNDGKKQNEEKNDFWVSEYPLSTADEIELYFHQLLKQVPLLIKEGGSVYRDDLAMTLVAMAHYLQDIDQPNENGIVKLKSKTIKRRINTAFVLSLKYLFSDAIREIYRTVQNLGQVISPEMEMAFLKEKGFNLDIQDDVYKKFIISMIDEIKKEKSSLNSRSTLFSEHSSYSSGFFAKSTSVSGQNSSGDHSPVPQFTLTDDIFDDLKLHEQVNFMKREMAEACDIPHLKGLGNLSTAYNRTIDALNFEEAGEDQDKIKERVKLITNEFGLFYQFAKEILELTKEVNKEGGLAFLVNKLNKEIHDYCDEIAKSQISAIDDAARDHAESLVTKLLLFCDELQLISDQPISEDDKNNAEIIMTGVHDLIAAKREREDKVVPLLLIIVLPFRPLLSRKLNGVHFL